MIACVLLLNSGAEAFGVTPETSYEVWPVLPYASLVGNHDVR